MKNKVFNISLCGVISALSVVVMMLTMLIPIASYTLPALAGMLCTLIVIEVNKKSALAVYVVVSVLSIIIVPDKEAVFLYILFFGYYPILKNILENRIKSNVIQFVLKLLIFTLSAIIAYLLSIFILGIPAEEYEIFGVNLPIIFLLICIASFVMYDYAFSKIIILYFIKFRDKLLHTLKRNNN